MQFQPTGGSATIALSRAERDMLAGRMHYMVSEESPLLYRSGAPTAEHRTKLVEYRAELADLIAVYDQLGWGDEDPRPECPLTLDATMVRFLGAARDDTAGGIEDDCRAIERARTGRPESCCVGMTTEETIANLEREIDRGEAIVSLIDRLLAGAPAEALYEPPSDIARAPGTRRRAGPRRRGSSLGRGSPSPRR